MATRNEIADFIAGRLNDPLNRVLKNQIKFSVDYWRAELIRQDINKYGYSGIYTQKLVVPLQPVDSIDSCIVNLNCTVLRTKNKVPNPIRRNSDSDYKFVGSADGKVQYRELDQELIDRLKYLKFTGNAIGFEPKNGYIYVYNAKRTKYIGITAAFDNPQSAIDYCTNSDPANCYNDDMEYPLPLDMLRVIVQGMLSGEFRIITSDLEIPTNVKFNPNQESKNS